MYATLQLRREDELLRAHSAWPAERSLNQVYRGREKMSVGGPPPTKKSITPRPAVSARATQSKRSPPSMRPTTKMVASNAGACTRVYSCALTSELTGGKWNGAPQARTTFDVRVEQPVRPHVSFPPKQRAYSPESMSPKTETQDRTLFRNSDSHESQQL